MTVQSKIRMRVPEYLEWAVAQERGRYELVDGEVVAMAPERARHNLTKLAIARALGDAVAEAGLPCTVFTDGMTVVIDEHTAREPDASVQCSVDQDLDSLILQAPMVVIEVVSPSSEHADTGEKLVEYFSVPSIRHYLIVHPLKRTVIHHARADSAEIRTRIVSDGDIDLTPPGMTVSISRIFEAQS